MLLLHVGYGLRLRTLCRTKSVGDMDSLKLFSLKRGIGNITPALCESFAEAAAVCLDKNNHRSGVELKVEGDLQGNFSLVWIEVTEEMRKSYNNLLQATERGAYGIAFLLVDRMTDLTVLETSAIGSGIDYWLGPRSAEIELPFSSSEARLEVSGILSGKQEVGKRLQRKRLQSRASDGSNIPAYIMIVEFSAPISKVALRGISNECH